VMAYNQPSAQALFYFGIFNAIIWPMSQRVKVRFLWDIFVLLILQVITVIAIA